MHHEGIAIGGTVARSAGLTSIIRKVGNQSATVHHQREDGSLSAGPGHVSLGLGLATSGSVVGASPCVGEVAVQIAAVGIGTASSHVSIRVEHGHEVDDKVGQNVVDAGIAAVLVTEVPGQVLKKLSTGGFITMDVASQEHHGGSVSGAQASAQHKDRATSRGGANSLERKYLAARGGQFVEQGDHAIIVAKLSPVGLVAFSAVVGQFEHLGFQSIDLGEVGDILLNAEALADEVLDLFGGSEGRQIGFG